MARHLDCSGLGAAHDLLVDRGGSTVAELFARGWTKIGVERIGGGDLAIDPLARASLQESNSDLVEHMDFES